MQIVPRGYEGERQEEAQIFLVREHEHAQRMHNDQHSHRPNYGRRHVEHRL
jgi:hypothetical protein